MNDKENNIIYTAADIEQYLSGNLSPLQMHAMEKAALDDPFLAEAMEGYAAIKPGEWKDSLAALKNESGHTKQQAKIIALPQQRKNNWWKVAAAILLIAGTAATVYLVNNKKETKDIAETITSAKKPALVDTPKAPTSINTETSNATAKVIPQKTTLATNSSKQYYFADNNTASKFESTVTDSALVYRPTDNKNIKPAVKADDANIDGRIARDKAADVVAAPPSVNYSNGYTVPVTIPSEQKKLLNNNSVNSSSGIVNWSSPNKPITSNDKDAYANFKKEQPLLNRNFNAQVLGADNTPLPFANISIKSENFGTYADAKGNFRLVSSDSVLTVEVKAAGYQPQFYTLQSFAQQNKIVLSEDNVANRYKTVSGKSTTAKAGISRRATLLKDSVVNVEPADGWDNYNTYVDNNIEIPDDILKKDIHGQVEISFDVSSNGSITNIKVDKSLCDNCDEAAKRLIQQGPQWKVKKGKKGKGKVTVQF